MTDKLVFRVSVALAALIGLGGFLPVLSLPLGYDHMLWRSIPLAALWFIVLMFALYRFRRKGLWIMCTAPFALFWPAWLLLFGLPGCYYMGNCK
jgi:hypothetical protein